MKFLVVDDSSTMRRIVINTLTKAGYSEFTEAGNGSEAVDQLTKSPVDCVITDWNMPVMNGLEFVTAVRADARWNGVTLVMVTTESELGQVEKALTAGANEYVMKPFTKDIIVAKLSMMDVIGE